MCSRLLVQVAVAAETGSGGRARSPGGRPESRAGIEDFGDGDVPSVVAGHVVPELPYPCGTGVVGEQFHAQVQQVGVRQ